MCLNMHGLLHMISQKQKKIYPRGKINMRRNLRKSFLFRAELSIKECALAHSRGRLR